MLHQSENPTAFALLSRAEELLAKSEDLVLDRKQLGMAQAITASNLGIYHKRVGNHQLAVSHLRQALKTYEAIGTDLRTLVAANLNLCACLLEAGIPEVALRHVGTAVELQSRIIAAADPTTEAVPDDYATLAIAYHKVAECHEALRRWPEATFAYTQAHEVMTRSLGPDHKLTRAFEQSPRCPNRPRTPEVPRTLLPRTPDGRQTPRRKLPPSLPVFTMGDFSQYKLEPSTFLSWPPTKTSKEEKQWYEMARRHEQKQNWQKWPGSGPMPDGPRRRGNAKGTSLPPARSRTFRLGVSAV